MQVYINREVVGVERSVREMWVSKKKWRSLEKRVADLEVQVRGQQEIISDNSEIPKVSFLIDGRSVSRVISHQENRD